MRRVILLLLLCGLLAPRGSAAQRPAVPTPTPAASPDAAGCDPVSEKRSTDRRKLYEIFGSMFESGQLLSSERQLLQRLEDFRNVYRASGLGDMHYLSSALVRLAAQLRTGGHEDVAQEFLQGALELWPKNADAYQLSARLYLDGGIVGVPLAGLSWLHGHVLDFTDFWRGFLLSHRVLVWLCVLAVTVTLVLLVNWTLAYYRLWCHDISELLSSFPTSVSYLVGALLPMAPLLAGQGLLWSVLIVLVLSWPYASRIEKLMMLLLGLTLLGAPRLAEQASAALRLYDQPIAHSLVYVDDGEEWNEAVWTELTALAAKNKRDPVPHLLLGNLYYQSHCYFDAVDQYQQALAIDRGLGKALNNLANTFYQQNNLDGAIVKYQQAFKMDPDLCAAPINLNLVYNEKFEFDAGARAMDLARGVCPEMVSRQVDKDIVQMERHDSVIHETMDTRNQLFELLNANMNGSPPLVEDLWPARLLGIDLAGLPPVAGALLAAFLLRSTIIKTSRKTRYCLKCSRPTCPKCQIVQSSQLYCGQCVRLFILRSGIDAAVQREGVARTHRLQQRSATRARMFNLVLPGSGQFLSGRRGVGLVLLIAWGIVWALYLRPEMAVFNYLDVLYAPKALLNSALILLAALVWALANLAVPIQE